MKLLAPAKINLGLSIEKKLADGYHRVSLVNCQVDLFDEINLNRTGKTKISHGNNNTVIKTLKLLGKKFTVQIKKNIPIGSGLGGGSSDAAQVLKQFNRLDLASKIGLDVAYAGLGGVKLEEQGNRSKFIELPDLSKCFLVVCVPEKQIMTSWAYEQIDKIKLKPAPLGFLIKAIKARDLIKIGEALVNDFSELAKRVCPEIKTIQTILLTSGALGVSISGKGPATFGLFSDKITAKKAQELLVKKYYQTYLCSPVIKLE